MKIASSGNILLRPGRVTRGKLSSEQILMDQMSEGFLSGATKFENLIPMFVGSFAFRLTRLSILSLHSSSFTRGISYAAALFSEAAAFEGTSALFHPQNTEASFSSRMSANMLRFGTLRLGHALFQPSQIVLQHLATSMAMVAGESLAAYLKFTPRSEKNFIEQCVHAEVSNIQIQFSLAGLNYLFPSWARWESSLQIQERKQSDTFSSFGKRQSFAWMGSELSSRDLWYPREGISSPLGSITLRKVWKSVHAKVRQMESVFGQEVTQAEVLSLRPSPEEVQELWFHQMKDFVRSAGGVWRLRSSHSLLEPMAPNERYIESPVLEKTLSRLKERGLEKIADQVLEFEIPYEAVHFGNPMRDKYNTELAYVLGVMEGNFENTVRFVNDPKKMGKMVARIPSLLLFEALQESISQERFTPFVYVHGRISRDLITRIRGRGYSPIGLSRTPPFLGDIKERVHPWFFTLHDVYHASGLSQYPPHFRNFIVQHYERVRETSFLRSSLIEAHLDRLVDFDPAYDRDGKIMNYLGFSLDYVVRDLYEGNPEPHIFMSRLIKNRRFWGNYLRWMDESMPIDLYSAHYHVDLRNEVRSLVGKLDETLQQVISLAFQKPPT